jgi:hypothetical protein
VDRGLNPDEDRFARGREVLRDEAGLGILHQEQSHEEGGHRFDYTFVPGPLV